MTIRIVIAGAGGFGRGVRGWIESSPIHMRQNAISEVVFIDDGSAMANSAVISSIGEYQPQDNDRVLCAIANSDIRRKVVSEFRQKGARFHTFVDDRATLGARVKIGEGTIVCPGSVVSADASLGEQVHVNFNCSIGHDVQLGDYSTLSPTVTIGGEVDVSESVFFGAAANVLPRVSIGEGVVIGASAVVLRSVEANSVMVGNPARRLDQ